MGITGLLPFLKKSSEPCHVRDLAHSTVAIDVYCWLHKGAFGCAQKLVQAQPTTGYILYVMKYLDLLLHHNIKPILVFDGRNLPSKSSTELKRRENRTKYKKMAKEHLREGRLREATECFQRCVDITPEMARETIQACQERNIDCIVAPYEADAQLAFLNLSGLAQYVITEDSDLTLFGCDKIVFKLDNMGNGVLYDKSKLHLTLGGKADSYSFEKFRYMGIMSGCDYLASLPKIGLAKAFKFWARVSNPNLEQVLPKIPAYLNMPAVEVNKEYISGFVQANRTFLYQLVFDPKTRTLRPLNDYPEHEDLESLDLSYAGTMIDQETALQMALGNLDINQMLKVYDFDPDSPRWGVDKPSFGRRANHDSIWNRNYDPTRTVLLEDMETAVASQDKLERDKVVRTAFGDFNIQSADNKKPLKSTMEPKSKRKIEQVMAGDDDADDGDRDDISTQYGCSKRSKTGEAKGRNSFSSSSSSMTNGIAKSPPKKYVSKYFSPRPKETTSSKAGAAAEFRLLANRSTTPSSSSSSSKPVSWFSDLDTESTAKGKFIYRTDNLEKDPDEKETSPGSKKNVKKKYPTSSSFSPIKLLDSLDASSVPLRNSANSLKAFKNPLLSQEGENEKENNEEDEEKQRSKRRNPFAKREKRTEDDNRAPKEDDNRASKEEEETHHGGDNVNSNPKLLLSQLSAYSIDSDSFRFTPKLVDSQDSVCSPFSSQMTTFSQEEKEQIENENEEHIAATSTKDRYNSDEKKGKKTTSPVFSTSSSQKLFSATSETSGYFSGSSSTSCPSSSSKKQSLSQPMLGKRKPKGMSGLVKGPPGKGQKSLFDMWAKK